MKKNGWYIWDGGRHWILEWWVDNVRMLLIEWNKWLGCVNGKDAKGEWIIKDKSGYPDVTYSSLEGIVTVPGLKDENGNDVRDSLLNLYNKYYSVATDY